MPAGHRGSLEAFIETVLHGNHLHVSALQIPVQQALVGLDQGDVVAIDTELTTTHVIAQTARLDWRLTMLLRVRQTGTFSTFTHVSNSTKSRSTAETRPWMWEDERSTRRGHSCG